MLLTKVNTLLVFILINYSQVTLHVDGALRTTVQRAMPLFKFRLKLGQNMNEKREREKKKINYLLGWANSTQKRNLQTTFVSCLYFYKVIPHSLTVLLAFLCHWVRVSVCSVCVVDGATKSRDKKYSDLL